MKTLKPQKRHSMARPRKAAATGGQAVALERSVSRAKARPGLGEAGRAGSRVAAKPGRKAITAAVSVRPHVDVPYQTAIRNFETGVKAFQKQDYHRAAEVFEKLVDIDARDVAERAQVHLRLCKQRTGRAAAPPKSAEEYYALGVACLNARDLTNAVEHLVKADKLKPKQDHIHYALAVSHALGGNMDVAFTHLEAAFTLRPENRFHARRDEDFQGLAGDPRFRHLVHSAGNQ